LEKAPSSQRWVIGGVAATLIAGLVGITMALYVFPSGELLAAGLGPRELAHYVKFLDEKDTRYDIRDNGTSIYVYGSAAKIKGQFAFLGEAKPLGGYGHLLGPSWGKTRDQLRKRADKNPTVWVKIGTGGMEIERRHVEAIKRVVANAMPGILPESVKVMDESNEVLAGYEKKSETELVTSEKRSAELALEVER
jgi:flagellar biosynthesis/type III secretory pathway M-ring protein FliF/YscJ